ncbi:MAG: glycosyltransferase family 2 protein [Prevotella sp.]|nr:glycosyltransferase family 2 protein [Prevotella sp.]
MAYEVTIGIPVYNAEKYIRSTMDSVLAQTFQSIEFLILDDCGTDSSIDIIKEYQHNHPRGKDIHIVRQSDNGGIGCARNRIIDEAQGVYLYFVDADDAISPNTIELLYGNAKKYDAEIVYGSYERIEEFDGTTKNTVFQYPDLYFLKENEFADRVYSQYGFIQANVWNFLLKRDVYLKNGLRFKKVNYWEDFCISINLPIYIHRAVLLSDITYFYYCHYGSLSNFEKRSYIEKEEIQKIIDAMGEVKRNYDYVQSKPYFYKWLYKVMMTHFYMVCSILKNERIISPAFTKREIRDVMKSPLSFPETCMLGWMCRNLFFYLLGVLTPSLAVALIRMIARWRRLL